ncbi:MAG TPA: pilus assembly protein [Anaerolineaceae bacterium]|nr:pilus assembly protein [Anaerolineaceae bacterium]HOU45151.1 pilus assembly protein [Anaerolineaceae bacterium]HQF46613.1 pilus assembly protein [Anaerolineaceae bacterium]HQH36514.1 pilus assembly protein [Anaerolineaceae bacterium]
MKTRKRGLGQALVEFALLIPLFILIVILFIDLGRATSVYIQLSNAVREGTRYAIVHQFDEENITDVVHQYSQSLDHNQMTVAPSRDTTTVTIVVTYLYSPITPGLPWLLGGAGVIPLSVQSTATISPLYQ